MNKIIKYLSIIKNKDLYTYYHSIRVMNYATLIGKQLNLDETILNNLKYAALLHDIGKIYIPTNLLNKKEKLTSKEYNIIKKHTIYAYYILKIDFPNIVYDILYHHEKLNGDGYFKTSNIPINAQIIAIVDAFDAMTTDRGYNNIKTYNEAFQELYNLSLKNIYNIELVNIFYNTFNNMNKIKINS